MSRDDALNLAEKVFVLLARPTLLVHSGQKVAACLAFLQYATPEVFAEYPRECKAIVGGAFEFGSSWQQVADAAGIDITEAKRRWADVATPSTR